MKLFYFTNSFPYGIGEQWKTNELVELVNHFDSITVVPFHYENNFDNPKPLPPGVKLHEPLFKTASNKFSKSDILKVLFHKYASRFIGEMLRKKVYRNKAHFVSWLGNTLNVIRILKQPAIKKIFREAGADTVFYFYWGMGSCSFMPFLPKGLQLKKSFVRMHRYDLFEYVNNNYIPYRRSLVKAVHTLGPTSEAGRVHLSELYPRYADKIKVFRCGTIGNGKRTRPSEDGVFRILSCSYLAPVKRVHLMIEALKYIDFPVEWHHVGDGVLRGELEKKVKELGLTEKFIFHGMKDSRTILDFYVAHPFDLFVNVSESEGVPFSIMEAFSVGIPVLATAVGGTAEIVDETVGGRLPADVQPKMLADAIIDMQHLDTATKLAMRENAFNRYSEKCNASTLARELAVYLTT